MIVALSYVLAVILTILLAIILFPIAGIFWVLGLFGKASEWLFRVTKKTIANIWTDLRNTHVVSSNAEVSPTNSDSSWTCACGCSNTGKFCSECGAAKPDTEKSSENTESDESK